MAKKATVANNSGEDATLNLLGDAAVPNTAGITPDEENEESVNSEEIVEVPWESIKDIFEFKKKLENLENYFSDMCLTFEKNKASLMAQIMYGQSDLYNMAQTLQKSFNVNPDVTYELKLPANEGEKAYFLRKDQT